MTKITHKNAVDELLNAKGKEWFEKIKKNFEPK